MKHPWLPTLILVIMFCAAQLTGLVILGSYVDFAASASSGKTVTNNESYLRIGVEPPSMENESISFVYILFAVLLGTILVLLIIRFRKPGLWKIWYAFAVFFGLLMGLNPFVQRLLAPFSLPYGYALTLGIAAVFTVFKVFRRNVFIHNVSELFLYGGIVALLAPITDFISASILLVLISVYDAYAVWKSKHMVAMAEFQRSTNMFAGLSVPYGAGDAQPSKEKKHPSKTSVKTEGGTRFAILGGGDIAFPLLFSGAVMKTFGAYYPGYPGLIITATTTIALFILLYNSQKGRFYPAMPFLTVGCAAGLLISRLLVLFLV